MADVFPQADDAFNTFMNQFVPYLPGHATNLGISTAAATALTGALQLWNDAKKNRRTDHWPCPRHRRSGIISGLSPFSVI